MLPKLRNLLLTSPALMGLLMLNSGLAIAGETPWSQLNRYSQEGQVNGEPQVTSVSQLSDVQPTDWAFQALQSLVERYGCVTGYPDGTYRGNQNLSRYEFAAGLNACLDRVNELIAAGTADFVAREDLASLQRLQEEFAAELATLRGRTDALETRTAELEANQFSTTTKLFGEVVFGISDYFSASDSPNETVFQNRVRLNFVTTFPGDVQLNTRLDASNAVLFDLPDSALNSDLERITGVSSESEEGTFTFQTDTGGDVVIGWIGLYFPVGDKFQAYISPAFPLWQDFMPTVSPYLEGFTGATAALSSFAESNPIYKIGLGEAGAGFNYEFTDNLLFSAGYFAGSASSPSAGDGLFNGGYATLAQLTYTTPDEKFQAAATYAHAYADITDGDFDPFFLTGTSLANNPLLRSSEDYTSNSVGLSAAYHFSKTFAFNAFGLYQRAEAVESDFSANIFSWAMGFNFPDLGKEGNLGAILVGAEPWLGNSTLDDDDTGIEDDMPIRLEVLYRHQINDNVSITPGLIVLTAPDGDRDNDPAYIGTVRTTFVF